MKERFLEQAGLVSQEDLERFESFKKLHQEKIVILLESGFSFKKIKGYSIWNL